MIDWDKPIETVDGRKARLVETHHKELWWHLVWAASDYEGPGDVYMVNAEGCRCDSRSIEMGLQTSQFIRNVPVKREGWVIKFKGKDRLWDFHIYSSEETAVMHVPAGTVHEVVRIQWEEEP